MKNSVALALTSASLLLGSTAYAQGPGVTEPAAALPAATPAAAAKQAGAFCALGEVTGVDSGEAYVAARVVCDEVWRSSGGKPNATYQVSFGKLGSKILLRLESTGADGLRDERHLEMVTLDETSSAAPRLAQALVENKSLKETETTSNVLTKDTRRDNQKNGSMKLEAGIVGTAVFGPALVAPAPGLYMQLAYMFDRASLNAGLRFGANDKSQNFSLNAGVDYHLTEGDIAPFVGGGAAWSVMGVQPSEEAKVSASGFGLYAQAGVTAFRTSRTNFRIGLRADAPFYALQGQRYLRGTQSYETEKVTTYAIPVSITVGIALF
jgi:hypothetical protein